MAETVAPGLPAPSLGARIKTTLPVLAVAAVLVAGVLIILRYVDDQRERELLAWQVRLGIVADSRAAAVGAWLDRQFAELSGLAQNAALQIYMTEIVETGGATEAAAQSGYLQNLLIVSADRAGFTGRRVGPEVAANVERVGVAGLALLDRNGRVVVSTPEFPPISGPLRAFVRSMPRGARSVYDLHRGVAGTPVMGFAVPVFAVQSDGRASDQIGIVLGIKEVDHELYPLLRQPGAVAETAETVLVRRNGGVMEYISPLAHGIAPFERRLATETADLASAFAADAPGGFAVKRDYRDREVLVTGRGFAEVPWTLMHKIDRAEALADSDSRLQRLLVFFLLGLGLVAAGGFALWRHGASVRARGAAGRFQDMADRFRRQSDFLRLVTDSQPNSIFILDEAGHYRFANSTAAAHAGIDAADMIGKAVTSVLGPVPARDYARLNGAALEQGRAVGDLRRMGEAAGEPRVIQSSHIPMPVIGDAAREVLVVEQDVTAAVTERERRARVLDQLVETLMTVVDRRDPFAAHHSAQVAWLSVAIATEMALDPVQVETVTFAGNLLNLGKILVPEETLAKTDRLTEAEIHRVRESIQTSADLIEGIEFDGPVTATLRQCQERWDGAGRPKGLAGEDILLTARIVAVANAFVAMTSARAHRPGLDIDAALSNVMAEVGKAFDRRVVAALVNYLDNRGGRAAWVPPAADGPG